MKSRWRLSLALAIGAILLAVVFIDYRVQPSNICPGAKDVECFAPNEIIPLGTTLVAPAPGSELARYHGQYMRHRGLYSRFEIPRFAAAIGGIILPFFILAASAIRIFRHSKKRSNLSTT